MLTIVLGMAFLTAEIVRRARCAGHLSSLSSSMSHRSPLSIASMARSCWWMGMLVLGPPFPRADTGCIVSFLQPQVLGQSVYGRVRQLDTVSMEVPIVHTPVAERERRRQSFISFYMMVRPPTWLCYTLHRCHHHHQFELALNQIKSSLFIHRIFRKRFRGVYSAKQYKNK